MFECCNQQKLYRYFIMQIFLPINHYITIYNSSNTNKTNAQHSMTSADHQHYQIITPSDLSLPEHIGDLKLHCISWNNFKGRVPNKAQYSAHIYWNIDYEVFYNEKKKKYMAKVNVRILPRSWCIKENQNQHLLMHEYGHYLIGCICALTFQKKINYVLRQPLSFGINDWSRAIFRETLDEYLKLEKAYDDETEHRLNFAKQDEWHAMLIKTLQMFEEDLNKLKQKDFKIHKLPKIKTAVKVNQQ